MTGFAAVYRREVLSLWVTPLAWVLLTVFLLIQGMSFFTIVLHLSNAAQLAVDAGPIQSWFGQSIFLVLALLVLCPGVTMRVLAEERKSGTIEALLTAPVTPAAVVLGKYLATLTTYVAMWAPTLLYVVILRNTGQVDWPVVGASYLGVLGTGAGYLAVGVLASSMTESQLVALVMTALVLLGLLILGIGEYVFEPDSILREVCATVSVLSKMEEMSRGVVDLRRLVFDSTLVALPLFMAVRVVESWRWG
ncbi:MAG: ABC transporter permease [Polyangiaceae bacterium]|nr:ABC transporter permease [Polyangiaceae bacterium]